MSALAIEARGFAFAMMLLSCLFGRSAFLYCAVYFSLDRPLMCNYEKFIEVLCFRSDLEPKREFKTMSLPTTAALQSFLAVARVLLTQ